MADRRRRGGGKRVAWGIFLLLGLILVVWNIPEEGVLLADVVMESRDLLQELAEENFLLAILLFELLYVMTALFLPGALLLTVTGGMLFGTWAALLFVNVGANLGAVLAFLLSRTLAGRWIQRRFSSQLATFNREMERHGYSYLLTLRLLPVVPFFVVNYGAGLTGIPLRTFVWTTLAGMLPGSFIYCFAGNELGAVESTEGLLSWRVILAMVLLAGFSLMPVASHHLPRFLKRKR